MNRYQFTDKNGYHVGTVEARTAAEAREKADSLYGNRARYCIHLSDGR